MNKTIVIIIGIVVIIGAVFVLKNYNSSEKPKLTSTISQIPPAQVKPTPALSSPTPKPTITKPPTTSSSILDKIEAAIRAKLKR